MTKTLTQKEQVAVFVRYQPNCAVGDVSEALDLAGGTAGRSLRELSDQGVIIRSRTSVLYTTGQYHTRIFQTLSSRAWWKKAIQLGCRLLSRKRRHLRKRGCGVELLRCIQKCLA